MMIVKRNNQSKTCGLVVYSLKKVINPKEKTQTRSRIGKWI